jgi:hypothetical protein
VLQIAGSPVVVLQFLAAWCEESLAAAHFSHSHAKGLDLPQDARMQRNILGMPGSVIFSFFRRKSVALSGELCNDAKVIYVIGLSTSQVACGLHTEGLAPLSWLALAGVQGNQSAAPR